MPRSALQTQSKHKYIRGNLTTDQKGYTHWSSGWTDGHKQLVAGGSAGGKIHRRSNERLSKCSKEEKGRNKGLKQIMGEAREV